MCFCESVTSSVFGVSGRECLWLNESVFELFFFGGGGSN